MKKIFLSLFFSLLFSAAFGQLSQFRMIGSGSWTTVNDSTFSSTVTIQSDLTSNGFLPTGITDSMFVFTQTGQIYRIASATSLTFSSADLSIIESGGNWGSPVGQVMIYEDNGRTAVPSIPFGATGATAKLQEAIVSYNSTIQDAISDGDKGDIIVSGGSWVLDNGIVDQANLADDAVTNTKIADNAVDQTKIADGEVTPTELENTAVTPGSYTNPNITVDQDGRITSASNGTAGSGGGTSLSVLDTTFTANYTASTDSTINILTSVTESNDILVTLPTPSANTVGVSYTVNQIDRNADGLGFTLVQVDGIDYDFYYSGDTVQFVSLTPDTDESYQFQTIHLDGSYRWLATPLQSASFALDSLQQILTRNFKLGDEVTIKARTGGESFRYKIEASAISGYATDTINVVPTLNSKFAIIQPVSGKINLGWFTSGDDTVDDTEYFRAIGEYLRYSNASTLFVPSGIWLMNHIPDDYYPNIRVYGNLEGASRDSSIIKVDSIIQLNRDESVIFRFKNDNSKVSNIKMDITGNPRTTSSFKLTPILFEGNECIVDNVHLYKCTMGSSATPGNTWIAQTEAQNSSRFSTITSDTIFPGTNVSAKVDNAEFFGRNNQVILYHAASGNSDTTYLNAVFPAHDSLFLGLITDTIPKGAVLFTPTYGRSRTVVRNSIIENMMDGNGMRVVSQEVIVQNNFFRNNGQATNHHDLYNQSGFQTITNNWFEGGTGYAIADANKQERRLSGGRIISNNTFWNKSYGIQFTNQSNPVTWYSAGLPVAYYGNRVMAEGEIISNNVFYNTPNTPVTTALQVSNAFGGIDPNSVLVGNGSIIYSNNTHVGRVRLGAGSDYMDMLFSDNIFELNDTSAIADPVIQFPDSARLINNTFISRGPDHYTMSGHKLKVDNLKFAQHSASVSDPNAISFSNSQVTNSEFVIDTILGVSQTQAVDLITMKGGYWADNTFELKSSWAIPVILANTTFPLADMVNNRFTNTGVAFVDVKHNHIKNTLIQNNPGMRIWSDGQVGYPFGGIQQTENSGRLKFLETKTLTSTNPEAGDLIHLNVDSTYQLATYTDDKVDGLLVFATRFDSLIGYASIVEGGIVQVNSTNAVAINDYVTIDSTASGKIKSLGLTEPTNSILTGIALEDVTVWDSGTSYIVGDKIEYNNRNYVCTYPNTNQAPPANQFSVHRYWTGSPLKVQVIHSGLIHQARISGITNPKGGINDIQSSLDSLNANLAIDSSTVSNDSVFVWKNGIATYSGQNETPELNIQVIAGTATYEPTKATLIVLDMISTAQTLTLDPSSITSGTVIRIMLTNTNDCTLDSTTGNFVNSNSSTATRALTEGNYTVVWNGTNWYYLN